MRLLLTLALALGPGVAHAQWGRPTPTASTPPAAVGTLPPIGLPLASIGLPLAPLGVAADETRAQSSAVAPPRSPRLAGGARGRSPQAGVSGGPLYVVPYFWPGPSWAGHSPAVFGASAPATTSVPAAPAGAGTAPATLWLEVEPRGFAEVFVDGYFVGTTDDRNPVSLEPGRHRIELRAVGHVSQGVDVRAAAGASLTLRRTLEPVRPAAAPPAPDPPAAPSASIARKPFYLIPGCYLGDVPPTDAGLPPSCDLSKTQVIRP